MAQILFPLFDEVILAPMHTARAAAIPDLLAAAQTTGTPARVAESVREAMQDAESKIDNGMIVVSGSVYLVGEARSLLLQGGLLHGREAKL
jgi:dihydrofolate synthase/folylpolyglutamate synthase